MRHAQVLKITDSFNGDMMRMGKRSAFNDDMRFGKRGKNAEN